MEQRKRKWQTKLKTEGAEEELGCKRRTKGGQKGGSRKQRRQR